MVRNVCSAVFFFFLALAVLRPAAGEEAPRDRFTIARLKYGGGGDWYNDRSSLPNLLAYLRRQTRVEAAAEPVTVELSDEELFNYPFLFMTGHGNITFTSEEAARLRQYLENGGFLYADDDYGMDKSFRREIKKVFPAGRLVELPFSHPIYSAHYSFTGGLPKIHEHDRKPPRGYGIFHNKRLVVFYTYETNISDGWADPEVHKDPPEVRKKAFKMGTNIVVYALTQ